MSDVSFDFSTLVVCVTLIFAITTLLGNRRGHNSLARSYFLFCKLLLCAWCCYGGLPSLKNRGLVQVEVAAVGAVMKPAGYLSRCWVLRRAVSSEVKKGASLGLCWPGYSCSPPMQAVVCCLCISVLAYTAEPCVAFLLLHFFQWCFYIKDQILKLKIRKCKAVYWVWGKRMDNLCSPGGFWLFQGCTAEQWTDYSALLLSALCLSEAFFKTEWGFEELWKHKEGVFFNLCFTWDAQLTEEQKEASCTNSIVKHWILLGKLNFTSLLWPISLISWKITEFLLVLLQEKHFWRVPLVVLK